MTAKELEKRVAVLEAKVDDLNRKVEGVESSSPWWERIAGTFQDDPVYAKAMKLGRAYRRALQAT